MRYREQGRAIIVLALVCACLTITIGLATAQNPPQPPAARMVNQQKGDQQKKTPQRQEARGERQSQDNGSGSIKIPTEMVQLDVKVTDQNGLPVPGLTRTDFVVYEDKVSQSIESVSSEELDAIIATADHAHEKGKRRRKALVVITDGLEKNSSVKEKEVIEVMKEDEVQLYLVGFVDKVEPGDLFGRSPAKKAKDLLIRLAEDSGGRGFFPTDASETPVIAAQIAKDMREQYVISYYPSNDKHDGSFRSVRVTANLGDNRKLIARTRQGYYAHN